MSHYILHLPSGEQADVRQGFIIRKSISLRGLFGGSKLFGGGKSVRKKGYIVQIGPSQYRLIRSMDGTWETEAMGNFQPAPEDARTAALKEAITLYENQH